MLQAHLQSEDDQRHHGEIKGLLPLELLLFTFSSVAPALHKYETAYLPHIQIEAHSQVAWTVLEATGCSESATCALPGRFCGASHRAGIIK